MSFKDTLNKVFIVAAAATLITNLMLLVIWFSNTLGYTHLDVDKGITVFEVFYKFFLALAEIM